MTTSIARFKDVHSKARRSLGARRGFTLAEVLIALMLAGFVLSASTGSLLFLAKSTTSMGNYQDMNMTSRFALEHFASDARMTADVNSATATSVSLEVYDAMGGQETVVYTYEADPQTFSRTVSGVTDVLLEDVISLDLTYFNLLMAETTQPLEIKEVQLQAVMRRDVLTVGNTNEIISARFLMRNRAVSN